MKFDASLTFVRDQEKRQLTPVPHDEGGRLNIRLDGEDQHVPVQSHMHVAHVRRVAQHLSDRDLSQHSAGEFGYFENFFDCH